MRHASSRIDKVLLWPQNLTLNHRKSFLGLAAHFHRDLFSVCGPFPFKRDALQLTFMSGVRVHSPYSVDGDILGYSWIFYAGENIHTIACLTVFQR